MSYSNVFAIADDILIAGFDELGRDNYATLDMVLKIFRKANLKLNENKGFYKCTSIPFLEKLYHRIAQAQTPED